MSQSSMQPEPETHPVPRSIAPWTLKAESYMLFLRLGELPAGVYDSLESAWGSEELGVFKGGLGAVMIIRYTDTPVGPYDELMLIPGNFTVPQPSNGPPKISKRALRIARIYVSQRTTTYNGRLNWNIPKHLARFSFSSPPTQANTSPPSSLTVRVYPPNSLEGDSTPPFFACTLTPWKWVPAIPVNTAFVPISMAQVQPPIPEPAGRREAVERERDQAAIEPYDISTKNEESLVVGTERWCQYSIEAKVPRARGCWVEMLSMAEGEESEKWWPRGVKPWSVGGWMEDGVFEIEEPIEWKL